MKLYQIFNCNVWYVKYAWILNKENKGIKMHNQLIQDLRGLVKVFSILASTESLVLTPNCF